MFPVPSLAWSAFQSGSLRSLVVRPSRHARSGWVLVAGFSSQARAGRFAARSARKVGISCFVRHCGGRWLVSVPLAVQPGPAFIPVAGGVRGLAAALRGLPG